MTGVEWAEPPRPRTNGGRWDAVAEELRANPGKWARIATGLSTHALAHGVKTGTSASFRPAGTFEARGVTTPDGVEIYARYVGTDGAS